VFSTSLERREAPLSPGSAGRLGEWGRFLQQLHHADADRLDAEQVQRLPVLALNL